MRWPHIFASSYGHVLGHSQKVRRNSFYNPFSLKIKDYFCLRSMAVWSLLSFSNRQKRQKRHSATCRFCLIFRVVFFEKRLSVLKNRLRLIV